MLRPLRGYRSALPVLYKNSLKNMKSLHLTPIEAGRYT